MQSAILTKPNLVEVKRLVQSGFDPNAPIGCGTYAPLDGAIQRQNPALVELLISLGAKPTQNQIDQAAFCANHDAALKIVTALVKAWSSEGDKKYTVPIHNAVWRENTELIAYLLRQEGAQLDATDAEGYTPLMIAVKKGNEAIVDMLISAGADPHKKNKKGLDASAVADQVIKRQQHLKEKIAASKALLPSGRSIVAP